MAFEDPFPMKREEHRNNPWRNLQWKKDALDSEEATANHYYYYSDYRIGVSS